VPLTPVPIPSGPQRIPRVSTPATQTPAVEARTRPAVPTKPVRAAPTETMSVPDAAALWGMITRLITSTSW
jgi:hypothetical protein